MIVLEGHAFVAVSLANHRRQARDYSRRERELFKNGILSATDGLGQLRTLVERDDYVAVECTGFASTATFDPSSPEGAGRVGGYLAFDRAVQAGLEHLSHACYPFLFALDVAVLHDLEITPYDILPEAIEVRQEPIETEAAVFSRREAEQPHPRGIELDTITLLEERIRGKIDDDGKRLSDEVGQAFGRHDFDRVIVLGHTLRNWLSGEGQSASRPVRGALYALLADITVIEEGRGVDTLVDCRSAQAFYQRALEAYGAELSEDDRARLVSLKAKLEYLSGHREESLADLGKRTDPSCLSLRLSILIDLERFDEASSALRDVPPHEKWCDRAITAHVMAGNLKEAERILAWAKERDETCYHRSLLSDVQARVFSVFGGPAAAEHARPHEVSAEQKRLLQGALERLSTLLEPADRDGHARSGLQMEAHTLAARLAVLVGDGERCVRSAQVLFTVSPVPFEFANAAFRGDVPTPDDLPSRLRNDYPRSFAAQVLAAMLEARRLGQPDEAFSTLSCTDLARTENQKLELCQTLFEISASTKDDKTGRFSRAHEAFSVRIIPPRS